MPKHMQRTKVVSSNIAEIGHDETTQTVQVKFNSGSVWNYFPVTQSEHEAWLQSGAIGGHFAKHIRDVKNSECVDKTPAPLDADKQVVSVRPSAESRRKPNNLMSPARELLLQSRKTQLLLRREARLKIN